MKGLILQPMIADESVIVQFTQTVTIDKNTQVNVLNGFQAIVFIDEKVAFRINAGVAKKLCQYGKDYIDKQCRIAFVRTKLLPQMMWGFGQIQVNNEHLKEVYKVGANGKYSVEISDIARFLNGFTGDHITIDEVRDKTVSILRTIGNRVLGKYFARTEVSVFEIAAQIASIRDELLKGLSGETAFSALGLKLKDLTVEKIHVDEDDLELIKNRIKYTVTQSADLQVESVSYDFNQEFSQLKQELSDMVVSELRQSEQRVREDSLADVRAELEKNRTEISQTFYEQIQQQLSEFGANISSEIEDMITERLPLREEARPENIEKIKLTARNLIEQSNEDVYMVLAASLIYHKVEKNLITNYKLPHKNKKFYMSYKDYLKTVKEASVGDRYFLMQRDNNGILKPLPPRVIEEAQDGTPLTVEMHPIIRFMKAGLTAQEAKKAADMWSVLNKIRHDSEENNKKLEEFFNKFKPRKEYLKEVLDFYQEKGLYTED